MSNNILLLENISTLWPLSRRLGSSWKRNLIFDDADTHCSTFSNPMSPWYRVLIFSSLFFHSFSSISKLAVYALYLISSTTSSWIYSLTFNIGFLKKRFGWQHNCLMAIISIKTWPLSILPFSFSMDAWFSMMSLYISFWVLLNGIQTTRSVFKGSSLYRSGRCRTSLDTVLNIFFFSRLKKKGLYSLFNRDNSFTAWNLTEAGAFFWRPFLTGLAKLHLKL